MPESDVRTLTREAEAAQRLAEQIATMTKDDPEFLADAIEGETSLFESIDRVVLSIKEDDALVHSIACLIDDLRNRKDRIKSRAAFKRAMVGSALEIAGIKKREGPAATVSLKVVPPAVIITDESLIPSRFWTPQEPKLDRTSLGEALRSRAKALAGLMANDGVTPEAKKSIAAELPEIPGATLGNGSLTVAIRS